MNTTNYTDPMGATKTEAGPWRRFLTIRPRDLREGLVFAAVGAAAAVPWLVIARVVPLRGTWQSLLLMSAVLALSMFLATLPLAAWQQRRSPSVKPQLGYPRAASVERERAAAEVSSG